MECLLSDAAAVLSRECTRRVSRCQQTHSTALDQFTVQHLFHLAAPVFLHKPQIEAPRVYTTSREQTLTESVLAHLLNKHSKAFCNPSVIKW